VPLDVPLRASAPVSPPIGAATLCAGACAAVFLGLAQRTVAGGLDGVDNAMIGWCVSHRTPVLTAVAADLTLLGSRAGLALVAAFISVVLWRAGERLAALDLAIACSAATLFTYAAKLWVARPRPPLAAQLGSASGFSFPSGHTSGIAALLTVTALYTLTATTSRRQRVVLTLAQVLLALGVGVSRVYLGWHYPSDVVAGLAVGIACGLAWHAAIRRRAVAGSRGMR
jgi:membrane-associated phospholipid phosphatase